MFHCFSGRGAGRWLITANAARCTLRNTRAMPFTWPPFPLQTFYGVMRRAGVCPGDCTRCADVPAAMGRWLALDSGTNQHAARAEMNYRQLYLLLNILGRQRFVTGGCHNCWLTFNCCR
jgi:hypothetical protein